MNRYENLDNFMLAAAKVISFNLRHFCQKILFFVFSLISYMQFSKVISLEKKMSSLIRCTFALTLSPVAMSLEELLPSKHTKSHLYPILIRTALTISTVVVGLAVPFFGEGSCFVSTHSYLSAIICWSR